MVLEFIVNLWGKAARKIFGSRNERLVAEYRRIALRAGEFEAQVKQLSDDELRARKEYFRQRLPLEEIEQLSSTYDERMVKAPSETERARLKEELKDKINKHLEALLPEVFAVVREVADRTIGERPYDVQLIGGQVLHEGNIAEMATGEGKTLVATLPVYLNALLGRPVHVVSTNDYLIKRDQEWMGPIYKNLGLTVGYIQSGMNSRERQPQYACDVTYGTNNEFGFDYLRDNMKTSKDEQVQRELNYAIVDEVDSVLVDEARTPLIISGPAEESTEKYQKADDIARKLKSGVHFEVKEKEHQCPLSEEGIRRAEELAGVGSFYIAGNMDWPHLLDQALRAHHLYRLDKEYVVRGDDVVIVDGFTGRLMPGRQWSDGLHQAVEAKEGIRIKEETQTLATITFQNFFRMYRKLAGMTGTAMTEAEEFDKIYKLETVAIPTNRPLSRTSHADVIYRTAKEKYKAIVDEIHTYSDRGRPVLVGTISIENSELLSTMLTRTYGVEHEVLNAKFHEKEAEIVAKAGQRHTGRDGSQKGNVTIATNMAGRGTDIKLGEAVVFKNCYGPWNIDKQNRPDDFGHKCCVGCPEYPAGCKRCFKPKKDPAFPQRGRTECRADPPCGLHVIGTERHESRRIDNQLRGRSGRQGDPGSSRFFLSLEDDLMRIFASRWVSSALAKLGMEEGMALEHRWLTRGIEKAQKKVEERNFGARKNLLEYDEVMDQQRKIFYGRRQNILEKDNLKPVVEEMLAESVDVIIEKLLDETYPYQCAAEWAARELNVEVDPAKLQGRKREELEDYLKEQAKQWGHDTIEQTIGEFIPEVAGAEPDDGEPALQEADYRALAEWASTHIGVRFRERDLKDLEEEKLRNRLFAANDEKIDHVDCSLLDTFLDPDYGLRALAGWTQKKFDMSLKIESVAGKSDEEVAGILKERLDALYAEKTRIYPIEYAIEDCIDPYAGRGNFDFDSLAAWATRQYLTAVSANDLKSHDLKELRRRLLALSDTFEQSGRLDEVVDRAVRHLRIGEDTDAEQASRRFAQWTHEHMGIEVTPEELISELDEADTGEGAAGKFADFIKLRFISGRRDRMNELERYLLLQVHDTGWKDHLYAMDHLKEHIGLRSYAQKQPLIEYKREGLELFEQMLDRIRETFTDLFFKTRFIQREALGRIWAGQAAEHQEASSAFDAQREAALAASHAQAEQAPRKPIVRAKPRVGRNAPCPCGSGKKYKQCCGKRA